MAAISSAVSTFLGARTVAAQKPTVASRSVRLVTRASIYPEPGSYPGSRDPWYLGQTTVQKDPKNAEVELIHGRWAMLAVSGAWGQENLGLGPWFMTGATCTLDCNVDYLNDPSLVHAQYLWATVVVEALAMGYAEAYRTGLAEPPFDDVAAGDVSPGGRFDPLNLAETGQFGDLDELKIKELKHSRLAMQAWLGCIVQAIVTNPDGPGPDAVGPIANWKLHVSDPFTYNILHPQGF
mmetsp:Transcript_3531/g.12712  ORF Transcript_3531/g.12712 Transcript_3531/m.12712 type:complete len:237 (+) Transcript_3531:283-993(+)